MDEMRYMKLYSSKRKVYVPFNPTSKKKGAAIMLLTKDSVDSHTLINLPYIYNPKYYESLYIDRNITAFIDSGAIVDEDEGEVNESAVMNEAIIHNTKKPGDITILYNFANGCTPNDVSIVKKFYNEDRIMHWVRYFKTPKRRLPDSLTIYVYPSVAAMAAACLPDALKEKEIVLNSWSDSQSIHIVSPRGFGPIKNAEGNYTYYAANELITWAAMTSSPNCSRQLACYVGTVLSGKMNKKTMEKVEHNYSDVKDSSFAVCWAIKCLYDEEGDIAIRQLVRTGDMSIITSRTVRKYADKAWSKIKSDILDECSEQIALNEGYIIPGKDIESNLRLWTNGHNILYVTGLSGGGKSTTARAMATQHDALLVELDMIEHAFSVDNFLTRKHNRYDMQMIQKFMKKNHITKNPVKMDDDEFYDYFDKCWNYILADMKSKTDDLFVVEGLQIVRIANKVTPEIVNEPMIVKGTSALQAMIRRYNRENNVENRIGNDIDVKANEKGLLGGLKDFFNLASWYYESEKELNGFRTKVRGVKQEAAPVQESTIPLPYGNLVMESANNPDGYYLTEDYMSDGQSICFFNGMDTQVVTEAEKKYDSKLKKWLFKERLKNNKMVLMRYQELKAMNPSIKYTFLKLPMYRAKNIYIDLSYYHGLFLSKMTFKKDKAVNMYWDFLNRLIIEKEYSSIYNRITIFLPCWPEAWGCTDHKTMMDYKKSLNPIAMILRMLLKAPNDLKKWGDKDIVFLAPNGYFRINFNTFNLRDMAKFKRLVSRLASGEVIDDDDSDNGGYSDSKDTDMDTPAAITAKITDKIEKNMGIKLDDITGEKLKPVYSYEAPSQGKDLEVISSPPTDFDHLRIRTGTLKMPGKDTWMLSDAGESKKECHNAVLVLAKEDEQVLDVMSSEKIVFMKHKAMMLKPKE